MLNSLYKSFYDVVKSSTIALLISLLALITLRVIYLVKSKRKFVLYREILFFFFLVYLVCLFEVVTIKDINMTNGNNFIPFVEIMRYTPFGRLFYKNIVGNVIMFIPLGLFLGRYSRGRKFLTSLFFILLFSFSIEITQLLIGRVFDVDDIILNVFGGIIGYIIYLFCKILYRVCPNKLKSDKIKNVISIIFLILFILCVIDMFV